MLQILELKKVDTIIIIWVVRLKLCDLFIGIKILSYYHETKWWVRFWIYSSFCIFSIILLHNPKDKFLDIFSGVEFKGMSNSCCWSVLVLKSSKSEPPTYGSGRASQEGSMPQISRPYSAIVRSELNLPVAATFKIAIFAHNAWSWKKWPFWVLIMFEEK